MSAFRTAKGIIATTAEVIIDDVRAYPIDTAPWFNSAIYLSAMLFFGVTVWKAIVVAAVILLSITYNYGRRTLVRGAVAVLFFSLAVWAEIVPSPANWPGIAHAIIVGLKSSPSAT